MSNFILFFFFPNVELFYLSHKLVDLYPSNPVSKYNPFYLTQIKYLASVFESKQIMFYFKVLEQNLLVLVIIRSSINFFIL